MKKLFYIIYPLLLLLACMAHTPEKVEIKFINEAAAKARKENKLLILGFLSPTDYDAARLQKDFFGNDKIRQFLSDNFVFINIQASDSVFAALTGRFKPASQSELIFLDQNGNEIDRSAGYQGDSEAYLKFLQDISAGKNLFSVVYSAYKKDSLDVRNNYLLAGKMMFRNRTDEALRLYNKVLAYDKQNKLGLNQECILKILDSQKLLPGVPGFQNYSSQ